MFFIIFSQFWAVELFSSSFCTAFELINYFLSFEQFLRWWIVFYHFAQFLSLWIVFYFAQFLNQQLVFFNILHSFWSDELFFFYNFAQFLGWYIGLFIIFHSFGTGELIFHLDLEKNQLIIFNLIMQNKTRNCQPLLSQKMTL